MLDWLTVTAFALGAGIGALSMYLLRHRFNDTQALRRELSELQTEMESYRARVDEHFERTSDLFQEVTRKYRSLHDHLAQGATGLTRGARQLSSIELPEKILLAPRPDSATGNTESDQLPDSAIGDGDSLHDDAEDVDALEAPQVAREIPEPDDVDVAAEGVDTTKR
ncbi:MAG: YhcB family protein [Gammaproteobacteria bacterium]|nr:YhcB family protein [Gammaproteobacteria bacterium]